MKRSHTIFISFLICFIFAAIIFFLSQKFGSGGIIQSLFAPAEKNVLKTTQAMHPLSEMDKLKQKNIELTTQLAHMQELQQDNQALHDQFQTISPSPKNLLPVSIVNLIHFLPGISAPEEMIIDKGSADGLRVGNVLVYKDSALGKLTKVSQHFAQCTLLTNQQTSFVGKTASNGAIGIVKGQGNGQLIFDNVLLADSLKTGDIIVTNGDVKLDGTGFPSGLIVGQITSVEKNPSALFQKANLKSLIDITKLSEVFVVK